MLDPGDDRVEVVEGLLQALEDVGPVLGFGQLETRAPHDHLAAEVQVLAQHLAQQSLKSVETVQAGLMTELRYEVTLKDGAGVGEFVRALQAANGNNRVLLTCVGEQSVVEAE